jgi:hypothetical protein
MVTKHNQNEIVDKAAKIIDTINLHLDEEPECKHSLKEVVSNALDIDNNSHWALNPITQTDSSAANSKEKPKT